MSIVRKFFVFLMFFTTNFVLADPYYSDSIQQQYDSKKYEIQGQMLDMNKNEADDKAVYDMQMTEAFVDDLLKTGKAPPKFEKVCLKGKSENKYCVEDFKDVQVQPMTAVGLAKEYAKARHKKDIICSPEIRTTTMGPVKIDDYLACATTGETPTTYYEFHFDDVFETKREKTYTGILTGLGNIFYAHDALSYITSVWNKSVDANGEVCTSILNNSVEKFAMKVLTYKTGRSFSTEPSRPFCTIRYVYNDSTPIYNNFGKMVDNKIFSNMETRLNFDLEALIGSYVVRQLAKNGITTADEFWCDYNYRGGFDGEKGVLSCYIHITQDTYVSQSGIKYKMPTPFRAADKVYKIDFLFKDLSEKWDTIDDGAHSAMSCVGKTDGTYDGRHCAGITYAQCNALGEDVEWNPNLAGGTCILKAADKVASLKRATEIAKTVGVATTLVALTIMTGGATVTVLLAVGSAALTVYSEVITDQIRNEMYEFIGKTAKCDSRECIADRVTEFTKTYVNYLDDADDDIKKAVDEAISKGLEKYAATEDGTSNEAFIAMMAEAESATDNKTMLGKCFDNVKDESGKQKQTLSGKDLANKDNWNLKTKKCAVDAAALLLAFLPATKLVQTAAGKAEAAGGLIGKFAVNFGSKMPKTAAVLNKISSSTTTKLIKTGLDVLGKKDKIKSGMTLTAAVLESPEMISLGTSHTFASAIGAIAVGAPISLSSNFVEIEISPEVINGLRAISRGLQKTSDNLL